MSWLNVLRRYLLTKSSKREWSSLNLAHIAPRNRRRNGGIEERNQFLFDRIRGQYAKTFVNVQWIEMN